ncbi:MAG: hypothetical protein QXL94_02940 [Candidatus Parvarchaeum sp.]
MYIDYYTLKDYCKGLSCLDNPKVRTVGVGRSAYHYIDNNAKVLAVAHLDSVQAYNGMYYDRRKGLIRCRTLDDRLGVYIIMHVLPRLGINVDVLLTWDEERCNSSAQFFETTKKYNWIIEFDRMGVDVVMYQYFANIRAREYVTSLGLKADYGSYTDIVELEHLGCVGFNWGVGYHAHHSINAWVSVDELDYMIGKFRKFWSFYSETFMPYEAERIAPKWTLTP